MTSPTISARRLLVSAGMHAKGWFGLAVAATVASAAATLAAPALVAAVLDDTFAGRSAAASTTRFAVVLAVMALAASARSVAMTAGGAAATAWLRHGLIARTLLADPAERNRFAAGDLTSRLVGNCAESGRAGLAVIDSLVAVLTSAGGVVALWFVDWTVAVTFLCGLPFAMVILRRFMRNGSPVLARYQAAQGQIAARLLEALGGVRTIRAAGAADRDAARVLAPLPELAEAGRGTWDLQRATVWPAALLFSAVEVLVLAVAGHGVLVGRIPAGQLVATVGYVAIALGFIDQIDKLFELALAGTAARRVAEVSGRPAAVDGTRPRPPRSGPRGVTFRGIVLRADDRVLLDRADVDVPPGVALAVVGASGAGKSSLAALVGRLRDPDAGVVSIDGVPVGDLSAEDLGRTVAYAFDRPALLGATVRDALSLGRPDATDAEIEAAARAAYADGFIRRLPHGYATALADAPLSGGEVQRLGLARALVQDADVVVLDDATSSLDTATEARVGDALAEVLTDRTRIVIAHRASTAARADLVAWLDGGRIRAVAPHGELWLDPDYRELFHAGPQEEQS